MTESVTYPNDKNIEKVPNCKKLTRARAKNVRQRIIRVFILISLKLEARSSKLVLGLVRFSYQLFQVKSFSKILLNLLLLYPYSINKGRTLGLQYNS